MKKRVFAAVLAACMIFCAGIQATAADDNIVTADSTDIYVSLTGGRILEPREYINGLEIGIGAGVVLKARVYPDRRYSGNATEGITSSDNRVVRNNEYMLTAFTLNTVNLSGAQVMIDGYDGCFVYNSRGEYLGMTGTWLSYYTKYYVTSRRTRISGASSNSSSSSSSPTSSRQSTGSTINANTMTDLIKTAVNTAKLYSYTAASVSVADALSITSEAFNTMVKTAAASNLGARLIADTMNGNSVEGRIILSPSRTATLSGELGLGVYTDSKTTGTVQNLFDKGFRNKVRVISLSHRSNFGMTVSIAVKADLKGFDTSKLYLYSYNSKANSYTAIEDSGYYIDTNGYLHFDTTTGGEIVISEGALVRK